MSTHVQFENQNYPCWAEPAVDFQHFLTHQREICMDREKDISFTPSNLNPGCFHVDLFERKTCVTFLQKKHLDGLLQGEFWIWFRAGNSLQAPLCYFYLPPSVRKVSPCFLWLWEALKCFRRPLSQMDAAIPCPFAFQLTLRSELPHQMSTDKVTVIMLLPVSMKYVISCERQDFSNPSTPLKQQPHPINVKATVFFAFSSVFRKISFLRDCFCT